MSLYQIFNWILKEPKEQLLDSANSLLEWYMFTGINPVRGITESAGINTRLRLDRLELHRFYESMNLRRFFVSAVPPVVLVPSPAEN